MALPCDFFGGVVVEVVLFSLLLKADRRTKTVEVSCVVWMFS